MHDITVMYMCVMLFFVGARFVGTKKKYGHLDQIKHNSYTYTRAQQIDVMFICSSSPFTICDLNKIGN